jgi:peptidyl-prolyl cis-trans isomerase D
MLETLRKGAGTWVAKIFIGLLVMSFAVWGVADIFGGYGAQSLASVGDDEIEVQDYRFAMQTEMRRISQQMGRQMTMEDARNAGIDRQVLFRLVGDAALQSHGKDLNLGVSEQYLAKRLMEEPAFRGPSGVFDRQYFAQVLQANGMTEQNYVARQRLASIRRQLTRTMTESTVVPETLLAAVNSFENEKRVLRYITLPAAMAGKIDAPSEDDLRKYYETRKQIYRAAEVRKLALLVLDPQEMAKSIAIEPEEIDTYFEANKDSYLKPERRKVQQISFSDKAAAAAAHDKLDGGAEFLAVALEQGLAERDIDLGLVAKKDLVDPAIAEAVFGLKKGAYSAPVEGKLTTAIVRVTDIEVPVQTPAAQAKDEIGKRLARDRAANDVLDTYDRIEDDRAGGGTLSEIAKKLSLQYKEIESIDAKGLEPSGKPAALPGASDKLLEAAFEGDVGVEMDPIETNTEGYVWIDVLKVTPERVKPFEEVRDQVLADWTKQQTRTRLADLGKTLVERLKNGETLAAVAQSLKLKVQQSPPVSRLRPNVQIPQAAVAQAFVLSEGEAGSAWAPDGKARLVFEVVKVEAPAQLSSDGKVQISNRMAALLADDYFSQYLSGLRDAYGVTINEAKVNEITGRGR